MQFLACPCFVDCLNSQGCPVQFPLPELTGVLSAVLFHFVSGLVDLLFLVLLAGVPSAVSAVCGFLLAGVPSAVLPPFF